MKTRLPKAILLAVLSTCAASLAETTENTVETTNNIELSPYSPEGTPTTANNQLPSAHVYTYTEADNLTLKGDAKLGVFTDNGDGSKTFVSDYTSGSQIILNRPVDKTFLGIPLSYSDTYSDIQSNAVISPNFKINGTLTITENAQVVLGGQYRLEKADSGEYDEYTGLIADKVVVSGNDGVKSLDTHNAYVNTLEVNSGNVTIHTDVQSGNNYFYIPEDTAAPTKDSKQVRIQSALNVNGGNVLINLNQLNKDDKNLANDTCIYTGFGKITVDNLHNEGGILNPKWTADDASITSAWINQTDGILEIKGKTASVGGLNINQSGGSAKISEDSWHILADYGDSIIQQHENAELTIGGIAAYNSKFDSLVEALESVGVVYDPTQGELGKDGKKIEINPSISITQTGSGSISIVKGIDFTNQKSGEASSEISEIKQSGSGSINLSGTYSGVTFDVEQSGSGTINMNSSMSLNEVKLSDENGTGGKLNIAAGAVVTAGSITIDGGSIVNNGTINGVVSMAMRAAGETINITDGELVNSGTINASINMSGGTLVAEAGSEIAGISATGGDILVEGDFTMTGDLMLDGDAELIFADADYTIDLGEYDVEFTGNSSIALTLGDADISEVVLFTGAKEDTYSGYKVALLDEEGNSTGTAVLEYNEDGTVTLGAAAVPEPTTATLSLLALAALAARRRK